MTAKALGLTIPSGVLAIAAELIKADGFVCPLYTQ